LGVVGLVAFGGGFYYYNQQKGAVPNVKELADKVKTGASKVAFTGGDQGFLSLKLKEVEILNHNVKKFRFELPEPDMESGLHVACELV
jgi:cytochrome-b5 reductase